MLRQNPGIAGFTYHHHTHHIVLLRHRERKARLFRIDARQVAHTQPHGLRLDVKLPQREAQIMPCVWVGHAIAFQRAMHQVEHHQRGPSCPDAVALIHGLQHHCMARATTMRQNKSPWLLIHTAWRQPRRLEQQGHLLFIQFAIGEGARAIPLVDQRMEW